MMQAIMDKEIFSAQVIHCQESMFRTARAILHSDEDAEDAVQEAICSAFAHRGSLRDAAKFKAWILRILTNQCYDICRKRRSVVYLDTVREQSTPTDDIDQQMTLWQAILQLNDDLRAPVTLFYYDGLSIREISKILNISQATVKTRLFRGRTQLRRLFE